LVAPEVDIDDQQRLVFLTRLQFHSSEKT
jgi:hypothetical protein